MIDTLERIIFLKGIDLFAEIPSESLVPLARLANEIAFEKGETIVQEGDSGDCLFVIVEGRVDITVREKKVATLHARDCVGEMSLLDSEPRSASAAAATDVLALQIGQEDFYALLTARPEIARRVIVLLSRRLRSTMRAAAGEGISLRPSFSSPQERDQISVRVPRQA